MHNTTILELVAHEGVPVRDGHDVYYSVFNQTTGVTFYVTFIQNEIRSDGMRWILENKETDERTVHRTLLNALGTALLCAGVPDLIEKARKRDAENI